MAFTNPYTAPSISGYNSSPPPDDGSETAANKVSWSTHKTKLADPIKTLSETDVSNTTAAFAKTINTDADVNNTVAGSISYTSSTLTLDTVTGMATATGTRAYHVITSTGATGTLIRLSDTNYNDGELIWLRSATSVVITLSSTGTATGRFLTGRQLFEDRALPFSLVNGAWSPAFLAGMDFYGSFAHGSATAISVTGMNQSDTAAFVLVLRNLRSATSDRLLGQLIGVTSGALTATNYIYRLSVEGTTANTYSGLNANTPSAESSVRMMNNNTSTGSSAVGINGIVVVPNHTSSLRKNGLLDLLYEYTATSVESERVHGHWQHNSTTEAIDGMKFSLSGGAAFSGGTIDAYLIRN